MNICIFCKKVPEMRWFDIHRETARNAVSTGGVKGTSPHPSPSPPLRGGRGGVFPLKGGTGGVQAY